MNFLPCQKTNKQIKKQKHKTNKEYNRYEVNIDLTPIILFVCHDSGDRRCFVAKTSFATNPMRPSGILQCHHTLLVFSHIVEIPDQSQPLLIVLYIYIRIYICVCVHVYVCMCVRVCGNLNTNAFHQINVRKTWNWQVSSMEGYISVLITIGKCLVINHERPGCLQFR